MLLVREGSSHFTNKDSFRFGYMGGGLKVLNRFSSLVSKGRQHTTLGATILALYLANLLMVIAKIMEPPQLILGILFLNMLFLQKVVRHAIRKE